MFGAKNSVSSRRQASWPAMNCSKSAWSAGNTGAPSSADSSEKWMWHDEPSRASNFAMYVIAQPCWEAISFAPFL